jgi:hypothetical protein
MEFYEECIIFIRVRSMNVKTSPFAQLSLFCLAMASVFILVSNTAVSALFYYSYNNIIVFSSRSLKYQYLICDELQ